MQKPKNIFYAQSGGVTAVINASACGVIETARQYPETFGKVFAGQNGILGALQEELIDTSAESPEAIAALRHTPGGAFGSCRYKLKSLDTNRAEYQRLIDVFAAHNIGYFFYNGGGDSQDTAHKVSQISKQLGYPLVSIGIPKTIDNDLPFTDNCPGFGSVAKYTAVSIREAALDLASMCATSTKVFVMEVMGRHTGWIAAASGLAAPEDKPSPYVILFPEIHLQQQKFIERVDACVKRFGYCAVTVSEGVKDEHGHFLSEGTLKDAFGHTQLGGVAPVIAHLIKKETGYKFHWAVSDYLQRSARHIASQVDAEQAYTLGKAAVEHARGGKTDVMLTILRQSAAPYRWTVGDVALAEVANVERKVPREFITQDGFGITQECREYLSPLIQGEDYPPYINGIPHYVTLKNQLVNKILTPELAD